MMYNSMFGYGWGNGFIGMFSGFFVVAMLWSLFWKGLALWHSARRGAHMWFVAFLLVHTLGILELVYLFGVLKLKWAELFKNGHHS